MSSPIYDHLQRIFTRLHTTRPHTLPKGNLGKALSYTVHQCPHLESCFQNGQIEFDNNLTENRIRPTKIGAKNWLFIGREDTCWRSAVIYTVRRHGLDTFAYVEWVFEKLMHDPPADQYETPPAASVGRGPTGRRPGVLRPRESTRTESAAPSNRKKEATGRFRDAYGCGTLIQNLPLTTSLPNPPSRPRLFRRPTLGRSRSNPAICVLLSTLFRDD